jgi:hypothetical protein
LCQCKRAVHQNQQCKNDGVNYFSSIHAFYPFDFYLSKKFVVSALLSRKAMPLLSFSYPDHFTSLGSASRQFLSKSLHQFNLARTPGFFNPGF